MKPLIGLPGRRKLGSEVQGFPGELTVLELDVYLADYSRGVQEAGGLAINLPLDADPGEYVEHLDGIVLSGGADLEPAHYGQAPDGNGGYEPRRDRFEIALLERALARKLPVLGICRGLQILNVQAGGTLNQHVPPHSRYDVPPAEAVHGVRIDPSSELHRLYGPSTKVNSLHHQTVDRVGEGLTVTAWADDGTIEGMECPAQNILAVQWHPEMLDKQDPVFSWLVDRAAAVRARRSANAG